MLKKLGFQDGVIINEFDVADADNNGSLSFNEFIAFCESQFFFYWALLPMVYLLSSQIMG